MGDIHVWATVCRVRDQRTCWGRQVARCTKAAQCRARCTKVVAGPGRGGVSTTDIARASASGQLPQLVRHMGDWVLAAWSVHMPSQALCRWQLQGVAGGGPPTGAGWSMRTGHWAATTCSRHTHFAAMQAAYGQSWQWLQLAGTHNFFPSFPFVFISSVFSLFAHLRMWPSCKGHLREWPCWRYPMLHPVRQKGGVVQGY